MRGGGEAGGVDCALYCLLIVGLNMSFCVSGYCHFVLFLTPQGLFFQYPWNNFLHAQVEACVSASLTSTLPTSMDDDTGQPNGNVTLRHHVSQASRMTCNAVNVQRAKVCYLWISDY